jgi:hypothetical protein
MISKERIASFPNWLKQLTLLLTNKKTPEKILFITTSVLATLWFLARVLPKPSRATYPCMKVAAPLASSLIILIISIVVPATSILSYGKLKDKKLFKTILVIASFTAFAFFIFSGNSAPANPTTNLVPWFEPNKPVGVSTGIHPGRVVWAHNPEVANWDGVTGFWWEDRFNPQSESDVLVSKAITALTGEKNGKKAWNALFNNFNETKRGKKQGYLKGEKIAIKINENNNWNKGHENNNEINPSPQAVLSLLKSLINEAKIPQENISVFDASRFITDNVYVKCHSVFPNVKYVDHSGGDGRIKSEYIANAIPYSADNGKLATGLATVAIEADYLINMALLKGHGGQGVTLCGKNFYGVTSIDNDWSKNAHNNFNQNENGTPKYMTFVDFLGHKDLGGKTLLFLIDSYYGSKFLNGVPKFKMKMKPFNNDWCSSLFASQDGVAIDAVGADFIMAEWPDAPNLMHCDMYMEEAAMANNPPSGTKYDPEGDGTTLQSLGVLEHWDNSDNKQYSGNRNPGKGIELVYVNTGKK